MIEPTQQTTEQIAALQAELTTLKQAHQEVLTKRQKDKSRIVELESATTDLQCKLTESADTLRQITINGPLRSMAESMSQAPELFLEQFSKHLKLEMVKGNLTLLNANDGKPIVDNKGVAIPFQREALMKLLTEGDDARAKTFKAITIASRASGGASSSNDPQRRKIAATRPGLQFGLR